MERVTWVTRGAMGAFVAQAVVSVEEWVWVTMPLSEGEGEESEPASGQEICKGSGEE
jgi:hypothetical protein